LFYIIIIILTGRIFNGNREGKMVDRKSILLWIERSQIYRPQWTYNSSIKLLDANWPHYQNDL